MLCERGALTNTNRASTQAQEETMLGVPQHEQKDEDHHSPKEAVHRQRLLRKQHTSMPSGSAIASSLLVSSSMLHINCPLQA
eukprot:13083981-Alexandrium_andersonii.AAC.1